MEAECLQVQWCGGESWSASRGVALGTGLHTDGLDIYPEQRNSAVWRRWVGNCSSEAQKSPESRCVLGCLRMAQTPSYMECGDLDQWSQREKMGRRYQAAPWSLSQGDRNTSYRAVH